MYDVIIVGGGLSGLIAFRQLLAAKLDVLLLEARPRLGGRIFTLHDDTLGHYDLGPAWFWPPHQEVFQLADELKIPYFRQYEDGSAIYERAGKSRKIPNPQADSVSFRLEGGTGALIKGIQEQLPVEKLLMSHKVSKITEKDGDLEICAEVNGGEELYKARRAIITLPPRLAANLHYTPELPNALAQAMFRTPTWMGNAMKVVVGYDVAPKQMPFWRKKQLAGYAISEGGPCQQIHDHCSGEGDSMVKHALFGWVDEDDPVKKLTKEQRKARVLDQFAKLFGEEAQSRVSFYEEHDWKSDPFTRHPSEPEDTITIGPFESSSSLR